jgi:hypothetical protein
LTNRFKSVILINCEEDGLLSKYWLIMYRSWLLWFIEFTS